MHVVKRGGVWTEIDPDKQISFDLALASLEEIIDLLK